MYIDSCFISLKLFSPNSEYIPRYIISRSLLIPHLDSALHLAKYKACLVSNYFFVRFELCKVN
jgi:hypothetical protein